MEQEHISRIKHLYGSLHRRCYSEKCLKRNPNYKGCTIASDLYNFDDFVENIKHVPNYEVWLTNSNFQLDKDLLIPNNKIYSKETCVFIPKALNILFQGGGQPKETDLPNGVVRGKARIGVSYIAQCRKYGGGSNRHIGTYYTKEDAFRAYCIAKKELVTHLTMDYFEHLDDFTIDALLNYQPHKEYR